MIKLNYKRKRSDSQQLNPVLVSFEQSVPNKELLQELDFKVLEKSEPSKHVKTILSSTNHEKFEFQGKSLQKQQGTKYLIGVMGDSKDQMDIYDVDSIYNLQQVLKSDKELGTIDSNIGKEKINIWEQKQKLVTTMGTSKAQRKVQQQINNMIVEDKISSKEQMAEMLKLKSSQLQDEMDDKIKEIEKQEQDAKREFLPEFDLQANDPSKVYQMSSIISGEEFEQIQCDQLVVALKNKTRGKDSSSFDALIKHFNEYPKHLLNTFEQWNSKILKYKPSTSYTLKYIIYLNYLIKFSFKKQFSKTTIDDISKEMKIDLLFTKSILSKFYQGTPQGENKMLYVRNDLLKDKLMCHILVLCLFIHGFKFDGAYLALILRIDQKKIIQYAKEVGCSVSLKENSNRNAKTAHCIIMSLTTPFKLQANKKPMKDKK